MNTTLLLVGCGKMGGAMLDGWLARGLDPDRVWIVEPNAETAADLASRLGVHTLAGADGLLCLLSFGFDPGAFGLGPPSCRFRLLALGFAPGPFGLRLLSLGLGPIPFGLLALRLTALALSCLARLFFPHTLSLRFGLL